MPDGMNKWYVITGGNSSGKTTLVNELARKGYRTVPEAARTLIDQAAAKGMSAKELRADEKRFHYDVARLKQKLEKELDPNEVIFFDRGMQDTLAYSRYYRYEDDPWTNKLMQG